jgi:hypothetical protein
VILGSRGEERGGGGRDSSLLMAGEQRWWWLRAMSGGSSKNRALKQVIVRKSAISSRSTRYFTFCFTLYWHMGPYQSETLFSFPFFFIISLIFSSYLFPLPHKLVENHGFRHRLARDCIPPPTPPA